MSEMRNRNRQLALPELRIPGNGRRGLRLQADAFRGETKRETRIMTEKKEGESEHEQTDRGVDV